MNDKKENLVLIQSLELQMKNIESSLNNKYCELGKEIYDLAQCKIIEIDKLVDKFIETKQKYYSLLEKRICIECLNLNNKENNYCSNCGAKLENEKVSV